MKTRFLAVAAAALWSSTAGAAVRVTEFMYQGAGGADREFFELTNIDTASVDVSSWSYNDNTAAEPVNFGAFFGTLGANESVIFTQLTADAFRAYWNLGANVRIFSYGTDSNLGSADAINIYNSQTQTAATLVDSVTYSGTTRGVSRNRPNAEGPVANAQFVNSAAGDAYGSRFADGTAASDLGNPGSFPFPAAAAAVPEPASWAMLVTGLGLAGAGFRRRHPRVAIALA